MLSLVAVTAISVPPAAAEAGKFRSGVKVRLSRRCARLQTRRKKSETCLQLQPRPAFILLTQRLAVSGLPVYLSGESV
ncbi:hypothetical protein AOLI_G00067040 [Acnodon oligacanthus]